MLEFAQTAVQGAKTVELVDNWKLKSVEERIEQALVKVSIFNPTFTKKTLIYSQDSPTTLVICPYSLNRSGSISKNQDKTSRILKNYQRNFEDLTLIIE